MYIGEISKKTGLSIKAIRLYEELQLIPKPQRSGTYRVFRQEDVEILTLIKEAKELGVTLSELKSLVSHSDDMLDWVKVRRFMLEKQNALRLEIKALQSKIIKIDDCLALMNVTENTLDSAP